MGTGSLLLFGLLALLGLALLAAALTHRRRPMLLVPVFLLYGLLMGVLTIRWHVGGGESYPPNIPGQWLGQKLYERQVVGVGKPPATEVPRLLRTPQVYVPASVLVWGLGGSLLWLAARRARPWQVVAMVGGGYVGASLLVMSVR